MSAYTEAGTWCEPAGGLRYRVTAPLAWEVGRKGSGFVYVVPVGATFDVTVPPGLRWAFSPRERAFLKGAALHDGMLEAGWSRLTAGAEFAEALRADGVGRARRLAMWLGVSLWKWS